MDPLSRFLERYPFELIWQFLVDFCMNPADEFPAGRIDVRSVCQGIVDLLLAGNMGQNFFLQFLFADISADLTYI